MFIKQCMASRNLKAMILEHEQKNYCSDYHCWFCPWLWRKLWWTTIKSADCQNTHYCRKSIVTTVESQRSNEQHCINQSPNYYSIRLELSLHLCVITGLQQKLIEQFSRNSSQICPTNFFKKNFKLRKFKHNFSFIFHWHKFFVCFLLCSICH